MGIGLPAVAHATVHLDAVLGREMAGVASEQLRRRACPSGPGIGCVEGLGRRRDGRGCNLDRDDHVGEQVLDRLKTTDGAAELLPLRRVFDIYLEAQSREADEVGSAQARAYLSPALRSLAGSDDDARAGRR